MAKKVSVYSTPSCHYCEVAKQFLKQKGIPFREIDVAADDKAANEMVEKSGQMSVPVIEVDGEIIIGFNRSALEKALGLK